MTPARGRAHLAALACAALTGTGAGVLLRQPWGREPRHAWLWAILLASAVLGAWALQRMRSWMPEAAPAARFAPPVARARVVAAFALMAAAMLVTAWIIQHLWPDYHNRWHGTVLPWVIALILTLAGGLSLGALRREEAGPAPMAPDDVCPLPPWAEAAAVAVLAAVAIGIRLYRLGSLPPGIYVDETNGALDALYILEGRQDSPFGTGWYGTPSAYSYYMAAIFGFFGANWWTLKAASLIPAVLTVLAMYPLGRLLFGRLGGLGAMGFLALNRWHLGMSRWGWNQTAPLLFQVVATFFLLRGLRDRRARDFVVSGLVSGLMMYTYLSSRLALATLGLFAAYLLLVEPGGPRAAWRRHYRGLLLYLFAWGVAVAPIAVTHITEPFTFANRVSEISIFRDVEAAGSYRPLQLNVLDHLRFFHQTGDHQGKHNLPEEPHADPLTGSLFAIGLAFALVNLRDPRRGLLWLWLLFGMAGGLFSSHHESPQSYRTMSAAPALALFAGDILARLACAVGALRTARSGRRASWVALGVLVVGLVASGVWETRVYFGPQARSIPVIAGFNPIENGVARDVLAALDQGREVYVSPRFYGYSPLRFLVYGVEKRRTGRNSLDDPPYRLLSVEQDLPVPDTGRDALLIFDADYLPLMSYFRLFYPSATYDVAGGPDGVPMYIRARLTAADLAATTGLTAHLVDSEGRQRDIAVRSPDATDTAPGVVRIEWNGSVRVERGGIYDLVVPPGCRLVLDGRTWEGPRHLGRGLHTLRLASDGAAALHPPALEWVTPTGGRERVPESALFRLRQPNLGLTTAFYPNQTCQGAPLFEKLTPILLLAWIEPDPIPGQFCARFAGSLRITTPGRYRFRVEADDEATLMLDGIRIGRCAINQGTSFPVATFLAAGDHPIEIRYVQAGGGNALSVYWEPPGQREGLIPPEQLVPLPGPMLAK